MEGVIKLRQILLLRGQGRRAGAGLLPLPNNESDSSDTCAPCAAVCEIDGYPTPMGHLPPDASSSLLLSLQAFRVNSRVSNPGE
jgi:hypothetical protein